MTTSLAFDDHEGAAPPRRRIHWKTGMILLLIGVLFQAAAWWYFREDRTTQVMWSYGIVSGTALAMLIWWTFLSGLRWWIRLIGLAVLAVGAGMFLSLFTFVRNDGAMVPVFQLRSSVAERARKKKDFFERQQALMARVGAEDESGQVKVAEGDWPQFRGPQRDGIVRQSEILLDWPASWSDMPPEPVWRHPVGLGWSSFAIVDGLAFTQEQRGENECVVCYDAATGKQVWLHKDKARFTEAMGGEGPRATPTIHDSKVYALGATGILNCLDAATGKRLWTRNILKDAGAEENLHWAMAGSPLIYRLSAPSEADNAGSPPSQGGEEDEVVVVNPGGGLGRGVIGYDPLTGKVKFSGGDHTASYCAPKLATLDGVQQLLIFDAEGLTGHDARTAEQLWHFPWQNGPKVNVAQPIVVGDRVFISSGYATGSALLEVKRVNGKWPETPRDIETTPNQFKLKFNDAVYRDGYIYGLDEGILSCIEFDTLKRVWKRGRYGFGQLLLIDDRLLILSEDGAVALVEASPKSRGKELGRFQVIEGVTWNHPVIAHGHLYVRNAEEAACYDLRSQSRRAAPRRIPPDAAGGL